MIPTGRFSGGILRPWRLVAALALLLSSALGAGGGTLKDGPSVGYVFGGDVENETFGLGYEVVYEWNSAISFDCSVFWHGDDSFRVGGRLPTTPATDISLDVIAVAFNGRVGHRFEENLYLYAGGGFGYYVIEADNEEVRQQESALAFVEIDGDKDFGAQILLGAELVLTERWEVFAELGSVFLDSGLTLRVSPARDGVTRDDRDNLSYDYASLRLGIHYRF